MTKKILICDDDPGVAEVVGLILEPEGFEVKSVLRSTEAVEMVKTFQPHLILLDLWMPELNGEEVTKLLKGQPETAQIPVILLSANQNLGEISKDVQADGYLDKPFDIDVLISLVKKYVN